jgi:hypothetical protein
MTASARPRRDSASRASPAGADVATHVARNCSWRGRTFRAPTSQDFQGPDESTTKLILRVPRRQTPTRPSRPVTVCSVQCHGRGKRFRISSARAQDTPVARISKYEASKTPDAATKLGQRVDDGGVPAAAAAAASVTQAIDTNATRNRVRTLPILPNGALAVLGRRALWVTSHWARFARHTDVVSRCQPLLRKSQTNFVTAPVETPRRPTRAL